MGINPGVFTTNVNISRSSACYNLILFFPETPATATDRIFFETDAVYKKAPAEIKISWNKYNLTANLNAGVRISLWGYRESTIR